LTEESMFDILLVAREAVLNALEHGCGPGEAASLTAAYHPKRKVVRLIVSDPGPGHNRFPAESAAEDDAERRHRGLHLIHALSRRVAARRRGTELHIDLDAKFNPSPSGKESRER